MAAVHRDVPQGLHLFMVHNPELAIQRINAMPSVDGQPRIHKLMIHGTDPEWLARMPVNTRWVLRNWALSEQRITADNAETLGVAHAREHFTVALNYEKTGVKRDRLIFEGRNEPLPEEFPFLARYEVARITEAIRLGLPSLALCVFSVGQPATIGFRPETAVNWSIFEPVHKIMRPTDYIAMHQYYGIAGPTEAWPDGRVRWAYEGGRHLQCPWMDVNFLVTEAGVDDGVNGNAKVGWHGIPAPTWDARAPAYLEYVKWCDRQYLADDRIKAVTIFTHDYENNEWEKFDITTPIFFGPYLQYIQHGVELELWGDKRTARWQPVIENWAKPAGIDPRVIGTFIAIESSGLIDAISPAGAVGLMQIMPKEAGPSFADRPDRATLLNPDRNVQWGVSIFSTILRMFNGDMKAAVAGYFAGPANVKANGPDVAKIYLDMFNKAWGELWPGQPNPLNGTVTPPPVQPPPVEPPPVQPPPDPKPEPTGYKVVASVHSYEPQESGNFYRGKVTLDGLPLNGARVVYSWQPDGEWATQPVITGPHTGYPGWQDGYYSHVVRTGAPVKADWYTWLVNESGERISPIAELHFDGPHGSANQAVVDWIITSIHDPEPQPTTETLDQHMLAAGEASQLIRLNVQAALQAAMSADGFWPTGNEGRTDYQGCMWAFQRAEHPKTGVVRVYYCPERDWAAVTHVTRS
jgi:hypothetical protein